jgi:hypothetical protein
MSKKSTKEGDYTSGEENKNGSDINNSDMKEVKDCLMSSLVFSNFLREVYYRVTIPHLLVGLISQDYKPEY